MKQLNLKYAWWTTYGESRHAVMQAPNFRLYADNLKARKVR